MNDSMSKENANPTVHAVRKRRTKGKSHKPIGWNQVERFNFVSENTKNIHGGSADSPRSSLDENVLQTLPSDWNTARSAKERAIFLALIDTAGSSSSQQQQEKNVGLLKTAGFGIYSTIPKPVPQALRQPAFIPATLSSSSVPRSNNGGAMLPKEGKISTVSKTARRDKIDSEEVFNIIRNIQDPEHPLTLEQLNVVNLDHVDVYDSLAATAVDNDDEEEGKGSKRGPLSTVEVRFTPTIPHCSMATLIGLCIRVKLLQALPMRFKVTVKIQPGTHASEKAVNKQLSDKERVCAALENSHLLGVVNRCILEGMKSSSSHIM
eukprot:CAMPEP_0195296866 /NCGR_PEP_ID=MMETSP0707-20130614/20316_1 /TAXON_ID=33640 /ORGANISM="Asterionellopsis glacialis, Strain CCMP134" /LENGTH=320 /DNA_ID=CAMNT_0040358493 /DNA_START=93 /DNA_END=1055 /DNA_ORIENTATION=-